MSKSSKGTMKRSNSVSGVFIDAPAFKLKSERPLSAFVPQTLYSVHRSPMSRNSENVEYVKEEALNKDIKTKKRQMHHGRSLTGERASSASTHSLFSSHEMYDARAGLTTASDNYSKRYSTMSNDSFDRKQFSRIEKTRTTGRRKFKGGQS